MAKTKTPRTPRPPKAPPVVPPVKPDEPDSNEPAAPLDGVASPPPVLCLEVIMRTGADQPVAHREADGHTALGVGATLRLPEGIVQADMENFRIVELSSGTQDLSFEVRSRERVQNYYADGSVRTIEVHFLHTAASRKYEVQYVPKQLEPLGMDVKVELYANVTTR